MRPRLRDDAYDVGSGEDAAFLLRGELVRVAGAGTWLRRLTPFLDGGHTLEELASGLTLRHRAALTRLVDLLHDQGVVEDADQELPSGRAAAAVSRPHVVLTGEGRLHAATLDALLTAGWRSVHTTSERGAISTYPIEKVILHTTDDLSPHAAAAVERAASSGTPVGLAALRAGYGWIGPVGVYTGAAALWTRIDRTADREGPSPSDQAVRQIARQFVRLVERTLDGEQREPVMRLVHAESLFTTPIRVLPHPLAAPAEVGSPGGAVYAVRRLRAGAPVCVEDLDRQVAACIDPTVGIFRAVSEHDFAQSPLHVTEIDVAAPTGRLPVRAAARTYTDARRAAALRALAAYAVRVVDARRLGPGRTVWGVRLPDGEPVQLPAALVFEAAGPDLPVGVAAGCSWGQALQAALLSHVVADARHRLGTRHVDPTARDIELDQCEPAIRALWTMLGGAGKPLQVLDVTGTLDVPVVAVMCGEDVIGCAAGVDQPAAARDALAQALLHAQSTWHSDPRYASTPVDVPTAGAPTADAEPVSLVDAFRRNGTAPVVVPLDHDPAVHAVLPYVLRAVLVDG
ncbi:YcaO-like family protein [Salinispora pacifica]|uniref:YcaO-like family protein n=1 Tax=Salinispora pacifica TaxID=351187 RepID=UPI000487C06C|nr:YcaO-like family protein [Salinispora pacifica]